MLCKISSPGDSGHSEGHSVHCCSTHHSLEMGNLEESPVHPSNDLGIILHCRHRRKTKEKDFKRSLAKFFFFKGKISKVLNTQEDMLNRKLTLNRRLTNIFILYFPSSWMSKASIKKSTPMILTDLIHLFNKHLTGYLLCARHSIRS